MSEIERKPMEEWNIAKAAELLNEAQWALTIAELCAKEKHKRLADIVMDYLDVIEDEMAKYMGFDSNKDFQAFIEEKKHLALGLKVCSEMIDKFCSYLESNGYFAGIYSFDSFYTNISDDVKRKYSKWVARVENIKPTKCENYDLWQFTWKASIKGISGECDCSYCYKDFPAIIKAAGLNGNDTASEKYNITARISNLDKKSAIDISDACQRLGMTVVLSSN